MQEHFIEPKKHSLVVIDRQRAVAEAIGMALASLGPFSVMDEMCDAGAVRTSLKTISPALIVTDLSLPGVAANEWIARLRRASGRSRILVFADSDEPGEIAATVAAGPDGFVHRSESVRTLLDAAKLVMAGHRYISQRANQLASSERRRPANAPLTAEERALARYLLEGLQTQEIAGRMQVSLRSLERRRAAMMVKLGFQGDLVGSVRWGLDQKLVIPR